MPASYTWPMRWQRADAPVGGLGCISPRPRSRARLLVAAGWIASTIVACAPSRFVPRPPGLEVFRDGLSVELEEREGDPSKNQPVRYGVQIASDDDPAIARASVGTSEERCAPGETPLAVDVEDQGGTDKHRWSLSARGHDDTFGVTVPAGTPAPAVDFALKGSPSGSSTCVRVPVEGDEIAWRRLHPPVAGRASYSVTIPTGTVALVSGAQMGELGLSEWWGPVRGTAFLGAGAAYCPDPRCGGQPDNTSGHFAATGGAGIDAFPFLGSFALGVDFALNLGVGER
jgi:hypothetical protein